MHLAVLKGRFLRGLSVQRARLFSRWKHVGFMTRIHSRVLMEVVVHTLSVPASACLPAGSLPSFLPTSRMVPTRRRLRSSFFDASVSGRRGALSAFCGFLSLSLSYLLLVLNFCSSNFYTLLLQKLILLFDFSFYISLIFIYYYFSFIITVCTVSNRQIFLYILLQMSLEYMP